MINVKNLLENKIDEKYDDKVFWYASEVLINEKSIDIFVKNENIVAHDIVDLEVLKVSKLISVKQNDEVHMKDVLISSGVFLFINDKLLLTQREFTTTFDGGAWTSQAGRCDRGVYQTAIKEMIEEIDIFQGKEKVYPDVSKDFFSQKENLSFYKTSFSSDTYKLKMHKLNLFLNEKLIETTSVWFFYTKNVNTIELRIPLFVSLNENELSFSNPEFNMPTELKSLEELANLDLVPAVKKLLEEIY